MTAKRGFDQHLTKSVQYIPEGFVVAVELDYQPPTEPRIYGPTYGPKLRRPYIVVCTDKRKRRVWAMNYGNSASHYIVINGVDHFLSLEVESMIEEARKVEA